MAKRTPPNGAARKRKTPARRGRGNGSGSEDAAEHVDLGTEQDARVTQVASLTPRPAAHVEPSSEKNLGLVRKSLRDARRTVKEASQWRQLRHTPYGLGPISIFALLGIVLGFDGVIFGLNLPEIVRDLDVGVQGLLTGLNLLGFIFIFVIIGFAYMLDRVKRVPYVAAGTLVNGIASTLTPHARNIPQMAGTRVADSVGAVALSTPSFSLITDYYPIDQRGKAFAMTGTLQNAGALAAPYLIGLIALNWGWRASFYVTGPLLILVAVLMFFRLKEPVRGYMERKSLGLTEDESQAVEPPVSFGQAWRTVWGIRTLRRLFIGEVAGGIGTRLVAIVLPLFLFEEYHLDVLERGKIATFAGVFALVGGFLGGGVVDSLMRRRPQRVLVYSGVLGVISALSFFVIATGPPLWVLLVLEAIFGFAVSLTGPARGVFYSQIIPANVRTLGFAVFGLAAIPSLVVFQAFITRIPDWGFSGVMIAGVPFLVLGSLIDISAAGFFERDVRSAQSSQTATAEYKRAKEKGGVKLLVCRDIEVDYDGVQVLFGVDFDVDEGEIVALLGTNGAGKSTLLKAISGVQEASGGAVVYDGREITHVPGYEIAGRGIAHAPGGRGIFPSLTVRENLELGRWLAVAAGDQADGEIDPLDVRPLSDVEVAEVLEIFPALKERMDSTGGSLSGGEQQMVSLAQAFLARPRLLLIDELSLGLSPAVVAELLEAVKAIHKRGVTIVVVEQSVNVALTLAERAVFMEKGEVKFVGPTRELLRRPDILRAVYVKGTGALTTSPDAARRDSARRGLTTARSVLEVENLTKKYGGLVAVNGVSFALREGETLGLIGPNGAGKTTIFDLISGFVPLDEGKVFFEGVDVTSLGPDERARLQLVRRFQDAKLFPALSVYETILIALDRRHGARGMAVNALQLPAARRSERLLRRRADQLIDLLELGAFRDKFVKELSTGLRRITDIACILATEPRVLLLDEPSSGIAQAEAESLGPLLQRIRVETGCSILIIEHDMPLIARVADELLALDQGTVVMRGSPEDVLNDKRVIESYLGTQEAAIRRSGSVT